MNRAAMFLALLVPWAAGCRMTPTELVSKECGVSITMPGPPAYERSTSVVQGETIMNHQYRVAQGGTTYGLICTGASTLDGKNLNDALDNAKKGFLYDGSKHFVAEHDVTLQGLRGRELVMTASGNTIRNRIYLFPDVTLNISVIGSEAAVTLPAADRYLDSLRLAPARTE